jgi:protein SCO1/2
MNADGRRCKKIGQTSAIVGLAAILLGGLLLTACKSDSSSQADKRLQPTSESPFRGSVLSQPVPAADFTLTDQHGQPFRLGDQRGKVVLLFFGYSSCPDVCPTTLSNWKQVHAGLEDDAQQVRFVFVTVDPARDTPERLQQHLALFSPDFIGLAGTLEELESVYRAYGVYYEKVEAPESALGYLVNHTSSDYVIDTEGNWRVRHTFGTPPQDIVHDIRELLKAGD